MKFIKKFRKNLFYLIVGCFIISSFSSCSKDVSMDRKVQSFANKRKHFNAFGKRKNYKAGILKDNRVRKEGRGVYKYYNH